MEKDNVEETIEPTQFEFVARMEMIDAFYRILDTMKPRPKKVLVSYYLKSIPTKDIAREFSVTPNRIAQLRYDALRHMWRGLRRENLLELSL